MQALENCQWAPRWVAHMGCIRGCLDYLGIGISDAWLYGGTGHAFVINLHETVCPSGPTAWNTIRLFELGQNLGYTIEGISASKQQADFNEMQARAFEHAQQAIDRGHPCYGWELEIPEFYVIYGYDDTGYYFSGPGCDVGKGPKPWQDLGNTGIGILEMYSVAPGIAADDATTVKQALAFAVHHAANPQEWVYKLYGTGLKGFDNWIRALEEGKASDMGMRYNSGVWLECRRNAAGFLQEARQRLTGRADELFGRAYTQYATVAAALGKVVELYPWKDDASDEDVLPVDDRSRAAVEALHTAKEAEAAGLVTLERICQVL